MHINAYRCSNYEALRRIRSHIAGQIAGATSLSHELDSISLPSDINQTLKKLIRQSDVDPHAVQSNLSEYVDGTVDSKVTRLFEEVDWCDFRLPPSGAGGHMYVEREDGERVFVPHHSTPKVITSHFDSEPSQTEINKRMGFISYCVCRDCLAYTELDLEEDDRLCPDCSSKNVVSEKELTGEPCPQCETGVIKEIPTGVRT